jgi:hypothetical protein
LSARDLSAAKEMKIGDDTLGRRRQIDWAASTDMHAKAQP